MTDPQQLIPVRYLRMDSSRPFTLDAIPADVHEVEVAPPGGLPRSIVERHFGLDSKPIGELMFGTHAYLLIGIVDGEQRVLFIYRSSPTMDLAMEDRLGAAAYMNRLSGRH